MARSQSEGVAGHLGNDLQGVGVLDGLCAAGSPCERTVAVNEHRADICIGSRLLETLDDDIAGFPFVGGGDFLRGHRTGHGHLAVEIIRMGGAEAGDAAPAWAKATACTGMGVNDGANLRESEKKAAVRGGVGRRAERAFDDFALVIDDDDLLRREELA